MAGVANSVFPAGHQGLAPSKDRPPDCADEDHRVDGDPTDAMGVEVAPVLLSTGNIQPPRGRPCSFPGGKSINRTTEQPVLLALLKISEAVAGANSFDEVLEVIAEQALVAVGAASLSVSRWRMITVRLANASQRRRPRTARTPVARGRALLLFGYGPSGHGLARTRPSLYQRHRRGRLPPVGNALAARTRQGKRVGYP